MAIRRERIKPEISGCRDHNSISNLRFDKPLSDPGLNANSPVDSITNQVINIEKRIINCIAAGYPFSQPASVVPLRLLMFGLKDLGGKIPSQVRVRAFPSVPEQLFIPVENDVGNIQVVKIIVTDGLHPALGKKFPPYAAAISLLDDQVGFFD